MLHPDEFPTASMLREANDAQCAVNPRALARILVQHIDAAAERIGTADIRDRRPYLTSRLILGQLAFLLGGDISSLGPDRHDLEEMRETMERLVATPTES